MVAASATVPEQAPGLGPNGASRTASLPAVSESGASNTRLAVSSDRLADVYEAGVDTWRIGFKVGRRPPAFRFEVEDHQAEWFPAYSMLALEGHPYPGQLAGSDLLAGRHDQLRESVENLVGHAEPMGVLRLDSTASHRFADPLEGFAVLRGMAAIVDRCPGLKPAVFGKPPETVYLLAKAGSGAKLGRGYDPFFRGTTERGRAVRLEAQDRFRGTRPTIHPGYARRRSLDALDAAVAGALPRERFHRRFVPLWRAGHNVTVAGVPGLAVKLAVKVDTGELTTRQAETLGGYLLLELAGRGDVLDARTARRRRALLSEHGLALADDSMYEPVEIDLSRVLAAALETPRWG